VDKLKMTIIDEQFKKNLQKVKFDKNEKIIVAVSGGPDSVCLLDLLNKNKNNFNIAEILIVHFNHKLRGIESDEDAEFVKNLANQFQNQIIIKEIAVREKSEKEGKSIEQAGRELRYYNLIKIALDQNITKIFLAHNLNDLIETFFINLFRSAGIYGLTSLKPITKIQNKILFIRPLIYIEKKIILKYLEKNNLIYRIDSSNNENEYLRNKIRNIIIPFIENNLSIKINRTIISVIKNLSSAKKILIKKINYDFKKILEKIKLYNTEIYLINLEKVADKSKSYLYFLLNKLFQTTEKQNKNLLFTPVKLSKKNLIDCYKLITSNKSGKKIDINKNYIFFKDYNYIYFLSRSLHNKISTGFEIRLNEINEIKDKITGKKIRFEKYEENRGNEKNKNYIFDLNKVKFPITIRTKKVGDKFQQVNNMVNYKLKKLFINEKVLNIFRNSNIIIEDSEKTLIFVEQFGISEKIKADFNSNKYKIIIDHL